MMIFKVGDYVIDLLNEEHGVKVIESVLPSGWITVHNDWREYDPDEFRLAILPFDELDENVKEQ